jgi:hypothetical protein
MIILKHSILTLVLAFLTAFLLSACSGGITPPTQSTDPPISLESSQSLPQPTDPSATPEPTQSLIQEDEPNNQDTPKKSGAYEAVEWIEISTNGVDEDAFWENLDKNLLTEIATEFQGLIDEIQQKQIEDPESVFRGEWFTDVIGSDRYIKVVNMGSEAMKPLYWIIYKSDNQGLYEYVCSMALEELSGYDFSENGVHWATSKDFLERFTDKILNNKN